jgi:hypothetical protein
MTIPPSTSTSMYIAKSCKWSWYASTDQWQNGNIQTRKYIGCGQLLHWRSNAQKKEHLSASASLGVAEIGDIKAAATARTIAKLRCIVCEDVRWDQIVLKEMVGGRHGWLLCVEYFLRTWLCLQTCNASGSCQLKVYLSKVEVGSRI